MGGFIEGGRQGTDSTECEEPQAEISVPVSGAVLEVASSGATLISIQPPRLPFDNNINNDTIFV